jgi:hypothetical protein
MAVPLRQEGPPAEARIQLLLRRFARAAQAHHAALEKLDAEQAETQARILAALHESLVNSGEPGTEKLLELVNSSDPVVAGMAAVYSIRLDSGTCLATLRRIAQEPGLLGFRAGMAVERWESGEWDGQVSPSAGLSNQNPG